MKMGATFAGCFLVMLALFLSPVEAASGAKQDFRQGWELFHDLLDNPDKAKYRSWWLKAEEHFLSAFKQSADGPYGPKALYYLGRTYQELGKRSFLKSDSLKAVDYFQRVALRFPDHSWTDDAVLFEARVYLEDLHQPDKAYLALLHIRHNYPQGDKYPQAEKMLRELDRKKTAGTGGGEPEKDGEQKIASGSTSGVAGRILRVRHWSSDDYTRVVLDLDRERTYSHMLLKPDPKLDKPFYRLVVDVDETRLAADIPSEFKIEDGILRDVRTGQYRKDKTRVVLDVHSLDTYRAFSLENPYRIVVDVHAPESGNLQGQQGEDSRDFTGTLVEQLGLDIQTIMIDPGHGGKDPGAVFGKLYEKDINLRLAKILGNILKQKGFNVKYTRTEDKFVPLEERTAMANSEKADLFVSLHVNAHQNKRINGLEVYYLNIASSKDAVRVAARENAVSTKKISDLQVILTDLMLNSKVEESKNLADVVLQEVLDSEKMNDHGVRQAPFYVLMGAKMPAVLLETGYITNSRDRKKLCTRGYLEGIARGVSNGITSYRSRINAYAKQ
ncbi:MAG: N-acetylmuramoyl-L-alanine amidase [Desulfohalobiaceae bacterium]|nr:N-acetylmuramoyl-L-alanine amidase [Desulfohalobiaceae bacterium]